MRDDGPFRLTAAASAFGAEIRRHQSGDAALAGRLAALCFHAAGEGHSCLDLRRAGGVYPQALADIDVAGLALTRAFADNPLVIDAGDVDPADTPGLLVVHQDRLYLRKYWRLENAVIRALAQRLDACELPRSGEAADDLAVLCRHKTLALLTGGPGTGKTTAIAGALVSWLQDFHARNGRLPHIRLCAPTGKAAARMNESWAARIPELSRHLPVALQPALAQDAHTLHRLLGIDPLTRQTRHADNRRLQADLVVVDEASMLDMPMLMALLQALPSECVLVLVGDPNQLPSIEIGNVLGALTGSEADSRFARELRNAHLQLTRNHRQAAQPGLAGFAADVLAAENDSVLDKLQSQAYPGVRYHIGTMDVRARMLAETVEFHRQLGQSSDVEIALRRMVERVILTPLRQGPVGSETLNAEIGRQLGHAQSRHGEAVMVLENAPALGLANGDTGLLWQDADGLNACFRTSGGLLKVPLTKLPRHEPAYALTVHKAQGSEYGHVDVLLPDGDCPLLSKSLLYTAITRAKTGLRLGGTEASLRAALGRDIRRMNGLGALAVLSAV